jgi:hypothetical protein
MCAIAEKTDQNRVSEKKRPDLADCRDRQTHGRHHGAEDHRGFHADPVGHPAHGDATHPGPDPDQRAGQSDNRPVGAEGGGDRLEPHDDEQRRSV